MPKEIIRDSAGMFDLEVSWGAAGHDIQVAVVMHREGAEDPSKPKNLAELIQSWSDEEQRFCRGLYSTLRFDEINDLVRAGKRAREQVFLS